MMASDPYQTLGVRRSASDADVRSAYRRLVKLHHPDHNGGSAESARRFEEVQEAYARIQAMRGGAGARTGAGGAGARTRSTAGGRTRSTGGQAPPRPSAGADPDVEGRLADMERHLREAQLARERARQAARDAAAQSTSGAKRPSDEELGYVHTDDSFSKILADARSEIAQRYSEAREFPVTQRVADLIDELAAKLTGEDRSGPGK
jgi:hypothetical protein